MILADGMLGQMMEPVEFKPPKPRKRSMNWANSTTPGASAPTKTAIKKHHHEINSLEIDPTVLEKHVNKTFMKNMPLWKRTKSVMKATM
jgi:2-oxoglutarate/2-oxoacid ferredoxin oxidoreductase subunit alpha